MLVKNEIGRRMGMVPLYRDVQRKGRGSIGSRERGLLDLSLPRRALDRGGRVANERAIPSYRKG